MFDVSIALRTMNRLSPVGRQRAQQSKGFIQCDTASSSDIENLTSDLRRRGVASEQVRLHGVVNVGEIAALLAVPVNRGLLSSQHLRDEFGQHSRVRGRWILARTENVEVTQRYCLQSISTIKRSHVVLSG